MHTNLNTLKYNALILIFGYLIDFNVFFIETKIPVIGTNDYNLGYLKHIYHTASCPGYKFRTQSAKWGFYLV